MVLNEGGNWTELANKSSTMPAEGLEPANSKVKKSSMLGFLKPGKGRDKSPKPQEPGVLGKEGARHIVG